MNSHQREKKNRATTWEAGFKGSVVAEQRKEGNSTLGSGKQAATLAVDASMMDVC